MQTLLKKLRFSSTHHKALASESVQCCLQSAACMKDTHTFRIPNIPNVVPLARREVKCKTRGISRSDSRKSTTQLARTKCADSPPDIPSCAQQQSHTYCNHPNHTKVSLADATWYKCMRPIIRTLNEDYENLLNCFFLYAPRP